jgi:hypothetical protein
MAEALWKNVLVMLALAVSGCCASDARARAVHNGLVSKNVVRLERAVHKTARLLEAELLAVKATTFDLPPWCETIDSDLRSYRGCRVSESEDGRILRVLTRTGEPRSIVLLRSPAWRHARLARRGEALFVLVPKVKQVKVGEGSRCECEDSSVHGYTLPPPTHFGFVIETTASGTAVQDVEVPITVHYIHWDCDRIVSLAQTDRGPMLRVVPRVL